MPPTRAAPAFSQISGVIAAREQLHRTDIAQLRCRVEAFQSFCRFSRPLLEASKAFGALPGFSMDKVNSGGRKPAKPLDPTKFAAAAHTLSTETDRGCVLAAATLIEDALELLLRAKFAASSGLRIDSRGSDGDLVRRLLYHGTMPPLGSFAVRIKVCRALGLVDANMESAIDAFRKMRNNAAHVYEEFTLDEKVVESLATVLSDKRQEASRNVVATQTTASPLRALLASVAVFLALELEERGERISG